jgi:hypothetical protein
MWTSRSRLSPVERPWCRGLYLLVLDGPAQLLTSPAGQRERERESGKDGFGRAAVGSGKGAEGLAFCQVQTAGVRGTEGWFGLSDKKWVRDRS